MHDRPLGRTDLRVSAICLGTMTWGDQNTQAEGFQQMDMAVDHGVNMFDTAELYAIPPSPETQGRTEEIIGAWLAARGGRERIVLATKVVGRTNATHFRNDGAPGRLTKAQIIEAVDKSLRRLRTDYIDLYQIPWPDRPMPFGANPTRFALPDTADDETPIEVALDALDGLVHAGKIRFIGLSNESAWGVMTYLRHAETRGWPRVQSIQNAYNFLNRTFETALAEIALREDVGLLAYSILAQGYLTGKYRNGALPPGSRKCLFDRLQRYETPGAAEAIAGYVDLAHEYALDPSAMAVAFALSRPFMTSVIVGATTETQLKLQLEAASLSLDPEIVARIDALHQLHGNPSP